MKTKFFDPKLVKAIGKIIKKLKIDKIRFDGFAYQYRYNGTDADIIAFSNGKEVQDTWELSMLISDYFRPKILKARNENMDGAYIVKKFSKFPGVKLVVETEITTETQIDMELGTDS